MTELLRVYDSVYQPKLDYCVICLRSSHERRLVDKKSLKNFIYSINFPFSYNNDFQKICYICERQAAMAHRFRLAVNLSGSVHTLFQMMTKSKKTKLDILEQINGKNYKDNILRNVPDWEQRLIVLRNQTQLLTTEILSVSSLAGENTTCTSDVEPGESADIYVIPDAPPRPPPPLQHHPLPLKGQSVTPRQQPHANPPLPPALHQMPPTNTPATSVANEKDRIHDILSEPEIYMDSVVILDEEDPINIKFEENSLGEVLIEENIIIGSASPQSPDTGNKPNSQHIIPNKTQLVPIDKLLASQDTSNVALVGDEMQLMQRNPLEPANFLLHPIVQTNGVISVPSLAAQIVNGHLISLNNSNLVIQTPKVAVQNGTDIDILSEPSQVADILKNLQGNVTVVSDDIPLNMLEHNVLQSIQNLQPNPVNFGNGSSQIGHFVVQNLFTLNRPPVVQSNPSTLMNAPYAPQNSMIQNLVGFTEQFFDKRLSKPTTESQSIVIDDDSQSSDALEKKNRRQRRKRASVNRTESTNSENTGRIDAEEKEKSVQATTVVQRPETDWEDKIPMDVISFVDATDPNAGSVMGPPESPLGVISNVHSVTEDVHSNENVQSTEVSRTRGGRSLDNASVEVCKVCNKIDSPSAKNVSQNGERMFIRSVNSANDTREFLKRRSTGNTERKKISVQEVIDSVKKSKGSVQPLLRSLPSAGDSVTQLAVCSERDGKRKKFSNIDISDFIDLSD